MRFYTDFNQLVFENPAQYPATRPTNMLQVAERSAGGTAHVETYAAPVSSRQLNFTDMSYNDYVGLLDWFINKVNGMANEFSFEDEQGDIYKVRFTTQKISFPETRYKRFSGQIELEIQ